MDPVVFLLTLRAIGIPLRIWPHALRTSGLQMLLQHSGQMFNTLGVLRGAVVFFLRIGLQIKQLVFPRHNPMHQLPVALDHRAPPRQLTDPSMAEK